MYKHRELAQDSFTFVWPNMAPIFPPWPHQNCGDHTAELSHFNVVIHPSFFFFFFLPGNFKSLKLLHLFCGQCAWYRCFVYDPFEVTFLRKGHLPWMTSYRKKKWISSFQNTVYKEVALCDDNKKNCFKPES